MENNDKIREQPEEIDAIATDVCESNYEENQLHENAEILENVENNSDKNIEVISENNEADFVAEDVQSGSLGKFKDAESLLEAYNNLQAEFTRKCQKLSELQHQNAAQQLQSNLSTNSLLTEENKDLIIKSYLEELQKNAQVPKVISSSVGSGITVNAPPKPTSLNDCKEIVAKMFN